MHAFEEIAADLVKSEPMNRFLQGDVGSGKTVVAALAAYLSFLSGKKTLYMAPTEILAEQHFHKLAAWLTPLGLEVAWLSGSQKKSAKAMALTQIISGATRLVVGTSIGTIAAIVPLTLAATPFVGRIVENALREVDRGLIEAAQAMGATPYQIVSKVLIPEALSAIVGGLTITLVSLIGYSAMAGAIGGGGLGDLGIRYGYQRFLPEVMLAVVVVLIVLVQAIQFAGDRLARQVNRR